MPPEQITDRKLQVTRIEDENQIGPHAQKVARWFLESTGIVPTPSSSIYIEKATRALDEALSNDKDKGTIPNVTEVATAIFNYLLDKDESHPDYQKLLPHFRTVLKNYYFITDDLESAIAVILAAEQKIFDEANKNPQSHHSAVIKVREGFGGNPYEVVAEMLTKKMTEELPPDHVLAISLEPNLDKGGVDGSDFTGLGLVTLPLHIRYLEG